jgi:tetratricopeptide (TPR) repeat protein
MLLRTVGAFIALLCGCACYWSARWAIADYAIRSSIARGLRLAPGNPDYYMRLARAEPASAVSALAQAAVLDPLNSSVWIELAGAAEQQGDLPRAEQCLLRAVQVDKTFAPRWLLAQYYWRRRDRAHFWPAVRAALAASYDDITPLFDMCWELAPEPRTIQDALPDRPDVWRQYFDFLLSKNRLDAADEIADQIVAHASRDNVAHLLLYCDRLLEKNEVTRAVEIWNALAAKHLLDYPALIPGRGVSLTNGAFDKEFLSRAFDWRVSAPTGIFFSQDPSPPTVRFEFSGKQPEHCELLSQFMPLEPAQQYRFIAAYETEGLEGDTGIAWRVLDVRSGADLLRGAGRMMASQRREKTEPYKFQTPPDARLVKLVLAYDRVLGTVRITGALSLHSVALGFDR